MSGWKVTEDSKWTLIGKRSPQLAQMFYPVDNLDIKIGKGDVVAARCTMVSVRCTVHHAHQLIFLYTLLS